MADHMILWLGSSSGVRPLHIFFTPALKSTSTPSRSQNILYLDDAVAAAADAVAVLVVTIVDVVSLKEVVAVLLREVVPKYPERDCCVFACLDCCCCGRDGRLDMLSNVERSVGASEGIDEVPLLKQLNPKVVSRSAMEIMLLILLALARIGIAPFSSPPNPTNSMEEQ